MKIRKEVVIIAGVFVLFALVLAVVTLHQNDKNRGDFAARIISEGSDKSLDTIAGLKAAIAANEKKIAQHVQDAGKTAYYWKILAIRLQDQGLHGDALDALERAIYYAPTDASLHYYTGVSAGVLAKSVHSYPGPGTDNTERNRYYLIAEDAYLRAIELDPLYLRPRYGLAVLYVFELNRPEDAVPLLQRYLEISRNDLDSMFVLARAYYMLKRYQEAVDLYDRIITLSGNTQQRNEAQNNRQQVLGMMHG